MPKINEYQKIRWCYITLHGGESVIDLAAIISIALEEDSSNELQYFIHFTNSYHVCVELEAGPKIINAHKKYLDYIAKSSD